MTAYRYEPLRIRLNESAIAAMTCATPGGIAAFAVSGTWRFVILAATAAAGAWAVRRAFRLALIASADRVVVRNYWRVYEFAWLDVTKIGLGEETMGVLPQPAIAFGPCDGTTIRAQATPFRPDQQRVVFDALAALAPPSVEFFVPVKAREADGTSD
jgi:hypothetical protein